MSQWASENIVLGTDTSEPGPYRPERTPYAREWQDSAATPWVRQVTIVASTQVGKTQSLLNVLAYAIAVDPGPVTWAMPTREDALEFGENKVQPMVELSPALRAQVTGERFDAKKRQIRFRSCRILFRSSQTAKELAGYPARWLFADEANKWRWKTQGEAAPFDLARERTRTFPNHRVYVDSTPTVADGLVSVEFERGDRRRFHVPCPHCDAFQVLVWPQVRWDRDKHGTEQAMNAARAAWYECPSCKGQILDEHKMAMLGRGVWVPDGREVGEWCATGRAADRAPHRSYHIWAGYSPWLSWWQVVAEFLRSKSSPLTLQNFVNSWLAEPWVEKVEEAKPEALRECIGEYKRGEVSDGVRVITAAVDVQKRFLSFTIRGWGLDMESWLLDAGRVGDFDQLAPMLFGRSWPRGLRVYAVFMDARYRTRECIAFAKRHPQIALCRGVEFDDAFGAEVDGDGAVGLLAAHRDDHADALLERGFHVGPQRDLAEVRRADLFFAFAHQHDVDRHFLAGGLERMQRREQRHLRAFLVRRAAADDHLAEAGPIDDAAFEWGELHSAGSYCLTSYMK